MASLVFDTCCGCIKLKTGCFIIGYLLLVSDIIATILTVMNLSSVEWMTNKLDSSSKKDETELQVIDILNTLRITIGVLLFFIILSMAFATSLLVGLHKNKRGFIKAYLIYGTIFIMISVILLIVRHVALPYVDVDSIFIILKLLFDVYFLLVIRSHYIKLGEVKERAVYSTA